MVCIPFRPGRIVASCLVIVKKRTLGNFRFIYPLRSSSSTSPSRLRNPTSRPLPKRTQSTTPIHIRHADCSLAPTRRDHLIRGLATATFPRRASRDLKMATDEAYMDFLNKANEDPSAGSVNTQASQGKKEFKAADHGVEIPPSLVAATRDAFYISDADEPFVPVSLAWEKGEGLPDEEEIARLVEHWDPANAEVEILDPIDWDRNGQYKDIVDAVRESGKGNDVRVYRISKDGSRAEYFVVTRQGDGKNARLVGVKVLAIES